MPGMDTDSFLALLRERGHSSTAPRRLVWEVINSAGTHLTADEIASRVNQEDASVNLSSVYRTLGLLAELDLVRESNLGTDNASHWELAHPDDEFHLVCGSCGQVDHHSGTLVEEIRKHLISGHGFAPEQVELVVTGTCADCSAKARKQSDTSS